MKPENSTFKNIREAVQVTRVRERHYALQPIT